MAIGVNTSATIAGGNTDHAILGERLITISVHNDPIGEEQGATPSGCLSPIGVKPDWRRYPLPLAKRC